MVSDKQKKEQKQLNSLRGKCSSRIDRVGFTPDFNCKTIALMFLCVFVFFLPQIMAACNLFYKTLQNGHHEKNNH